MRIEHVAIWCRNLETLRAFYETLFGAKASGKYVNPGRQFESYFLSFASGARLELMRRPQVVDTGSHPDAQPAGYAHLAFSVGSKEKVETLTAQLRAAGYTVPSGPRFTGDGYFESVVLDPEGNLVVTGREA
jgi:lactoylglutathione lyase